MKKIYSPLLEAILALYLGFEWIQVRDDVLALKNPFLIYLFSTSNHLYEYDDDLQTNNILAPIITHGIYSTVVLGHGLWKIHDHRRRLRQRVQQLKMDGKATKKL